MTDPYARAAAIHYYGRFRVLVGEAEGLRDLGMRDSAVAVDTLARVAIDAAEAELHPPTEADEPYHLCPSCWRYLFRVGGDSFDYRAERP